VGTVVSSFPLRPAGDLAGAPREDPMNDTAPPVAETLLDRSATTPDLDVAVLIGRLSCDPVVTELPSGSVLHRYEVTARHDAGTDSVPVAWFDPKRAPKLVAGDRVTVVGRVRRRFFRAGGATRSATEVLATSVTRTGRNLRAVAALEEALAAVGGGGPGT
jgi:single-strand DNA-binding protein